MASLVQERATFATDKAERNLSDSGAIILRITGHFKLSYAGRINRSFYSTVLYCTVTDFNRNARYFA